MATTAPLCPRADPPPFRRSTRLHEDPRHRRDHGPPYPRRFRHANGTVSTHGEGVHGGRTSSTLLESPRSHRASLRWSRPAPDAAARLYPAVLQWAL